MTRPTIAALALVTAMCVGSYLLYRSATHVVVEVGGSVPETCALIQYHGSAEAWSRLRLDTSGGSGYVLARVCAELSGSEVDALPHGFEEIPTEETVAPPGDLKTGQIDLWEQSDPEAPWPCACSSGADCEWSYKGQWLPAKRGGTLGEGQWRGAGCMKMPCIMLADKALKRPVECGKD